MTMNLNVRNKEGNTALLKVIKDAMSEITQYRLCDDKLAIIKCIDTLIGQMDELVHCGASVNLYDRNYNTPLMVLATCPEAIKAVRYLCQMGATQFWVNGEGRDAIDEARLHKASDIAKYLESVRLKQVEVYEIKSENWHKIL